MAETIIALSSGPPPAGVAVIRASGPASGLLADRLAGARPAPRGLAYRILRDRAGAVIDRGLVLWFPGPASFTGEDCVEFHVHGSRAVIDRVLAEACALADVRPAQPGEFARRAFAHGKLDLTEAEALGDLIAAETEAQRRFAVEQAGGAQGRLYDGWRDRLLRARALVEAEIDFADEEDVPGSVSDQVWADVGALVEALDAHIAAAGRGRIMRAGFEVALVGAPNAGKSTLLNALAGSERAIVSAEPGTTRDVVEARLDLGGFLVVLADTAGLRDGAGVIEEEGIRRARKRAAEADLVLHLSDSGAWADLAEVDPGRVWRVRTKADLVPDLDAGRSGGRMFTISAPKRAGLVDLISAVSAEVSRRGGAANVLAPGRARHLDHLGACRIHLIDSLSESSPLELRAEALRLASDELGRITGRIDVEEMLGAIFSQFCIGK